MADEVRPNVSPAWATTAAAEDVNSAPSGKIDSGWVAGEPPPHDWFNFLLKNPADWIRYLSDEQAAVILDAGLALAPGNTKDLLRALTVRAAQNWTHGEELSVDAASTSIDGIAGSGLWWVAVGGVDGTDAALYAASHAGTRWYEIANPSNIRLRAVAYDFVGETFISVGDAGSGGSDAYIITMNPGGSVTERVNPKDFDLFALHVSVSGKAIAAGEHDGADIYAVRSDDAGETWAEIVMVGASGSFVNGFASDGTTIVAVGQTSGGAPLFWRSTDDGATFSVVTPPAGPTDAIVGVTFDGTNFVALGDDGEVLVSADGGATWTEVTDIVISTGFASQIEADPVTGVMIATFTQARMQLSHDGGTTWSEIRHAPMSGDNTTPLWPIIGYDGTAWAVAHNRSSANDAMWGAQSQVRG